MRGGWQEPLGKDGASAPDPDQGALPLGSPPRAAALGTGSLSFEFLGPSTGVYWTPMHAALEDHFEVIVANAQLIKNVPGRKTDV